MRALLPLFALALAACGFRPLHQAANPAGLSSAPLASIAVTATAPDDSDDRRAAFLIDEALEERIRNDGAPLYRLDIVPSVSRSGLAVSPNDVATRFDYRVFARYTLTDAKTGEKLLTDVVYANSSFGAPRDPYGRISAELSAAELASQDAADRIYTDLAVFFANPPAPE